MSRVKKNEEMLKALLAAVLDLCEATKQPKIAEDLLATLGQLEVASQVDGRAQAWDEERRQAFGAKIREAWASKRQTKGLADVFYQYEFCDAKPVVIEGREALAEASGLAPKTITNKLSATPDGFIVKQGRTLIIFARDEEAKDRLLQAAYLLSGNPDDLIELPSKKSRRF
jgi:hypothetical protein